MSHPRRPLQLCRWLSQIRHHSVYVSVRRVHHHVSRDRQRNTHRCVALARQLVVTVQDKLQYQRDARDRELRQQQVAQDREQRAMEQFGDGT